MSQNRTLTVFDEEKPALLEKICTYDEITQGYKDDIIINGDMLKCLDHIPDNHFHLIIIDPPYNLHKDFHGNKFNAMNSEDYEAYLRSWLQKVCNKLTPDGSLYMCGDWKCTSSMQKVIAEHLTIINRITWQREKGRGAKHNWKNCMEDIWFAVKNPDTYYFNIEAVKMKRRVLAPYRKDGKPKDWTESTDGEKYRITHPSNFWDDISVPFWSMPENTPHPTQKPEKLYAKLMLASSKAGDIILDPFLGSGTAAVVAKKLDRRYCGIEANTEYCLWAAKRLQQADYNQSIQGYEDGVFWERNSRRRGK